MINSRSCLNGSMSKWRSVKSGIPSGLVSELVLFNVITGDMDNGIKRTFSKVAKNTELHGVVTMLEGWDAVQRDLDRFQSLWDCANLVKFNKVECKALPLDQGNSKHKYRLGRKWINSDPEENDLKVLLTRSPVQPRKAAIFWAASKEAWPPGQGGDSSPLVCSGETLHCDTPT